MRLKDTDRLTTKVWENVHHSHSNQKTGGVAVLISDKIDFKTKIVTTDKGGHFIRVKESIHQEK